MPEELNNIRIDDEILVRSCQRGDLDAMGRLIVKYQDRLYNTLLKICCNPDDAAELTQETFVKVIESITSFQGKSSFYTWLFRIGVNLTLTFIKRQQKIPMHSLDAPVNEDAESAGNRLAAFLAGREKADPAVLAENREVQAILMQMLERLEESQRVVLILRDIEGMGYQEIAEVLSIELGTVKSRISRARAGLRNLLQTVLA